MLKPQASVHLLPTRVTPGWLRGLHPESPFPLKEVLEGSLYYPSSGRDGDPVRYLGGATHSFVFIRADGAFAYQALYHANGRAPAAVAIIQPGHGFGGNWTNFEDPHGILARAVRATPGGPPSHLLFGGWTRRVPTEPCWPEYAHGLGGWRAAAGGLSLWERPSRLRSP